MLGLLDAVDDVLVQPFVPDGAVVALNVSVLLRLTRLDMGQDDALFLSPLQQRMTDLFGAVVVYADGLGLAAPSDDVVEALDDPVGRRRKVHLDAKVFDRSRSARSALGRHERP